MNERSVVFAVRNHINTGDRRGRTGGPGVKEVEKSPPYLESALRCPSNLASTI